MEAPEPDATVRLFRRVFQLNRILHQLIDRPVLERTGLTSAELNVLRAVYLGFDRPRAIAGRMALAPPTVSRALSTLERRRLIVRSEATDDRRQTVVRATDAAAEPLRQSEAIVVAELQRAFPAVEASVVARAVAALDALWFGLGIDDGYPDDRARARDHPPR